MDMNRIEEQARYYQNLPLRDSTLARYFVMVRMLPLKQTFLTKHFIPKDMPKLIMYNQISLK